MKKYYYVQYQSGDVAVFTEAMYVPNYYGDDNPEQSVVHGTRDEIELYMGNLDWYYVIGSEFE